MPKAKFRLALIVTVIAVAGLLIAKPFLHRKISGTAWTDPLRAAVDGADRLVVHDLNFHQRGLQPDWEIRGVDKVRELLSVIDIDPQQSGFHCMCDGEFWIHVYRGDQEVATLGYHHGRSLRWLRGAWQGDGMLTAVAKEAVPHWFKQQGCAYLHDLCEYLAEGDRRRNAEVERFVACFPEAVRPHFRESSSGPDADAEAALGRRIAQGIGDGEAVAVAVCRALGSAPRTWTTFTAKEQRALAAMRTVTGAEFGRALRQLQDDPVALCGAARVFFREGFHKVVPPAARTEWVVRLASAVVTDGLDEDKPSVLRFLEQEPDPQVRSLLRDVFRGKLGKEIDLAKAYGEEPGLRTGAALTLVLTGDAAIKPEIEQMLPQVTAKADIAALEVCLALLGDPSYIKAEHFRLQSYSIGEAGLKAIERFNGKHGIEALVKGGIHHPWGYVNDEALKTFARITGRELSRGEIEDWWEVEHEGQQRPQPVLQLKSDSHQLRCVKYSVDGKLLAAGSNDSTARVWNAQTGALVHTLRGHTFTILDVAFHPNGQQLATASGDLTVKIWDLVTGKPVRTLPGHQRWAARVAYRPDGKELISMEDTGRLRFWDASSGRLLRTLQDNEHGQGRVLVFRPDGQRLATANETIQIWNLANGAIERTLPTRRPAAVAFSPDGKRLLTAEGDLKAVRCWDAATGAVLWTNNSHADYLNSVAFDPNGKYVAAAGWAKVVTLHDAGTGAVLCSFKAHPESINALAFSPDGKHLATASEDRTIRVWDVAALLAKQQAK